MIDALKIFPSVSTQDLPRMADFTLLGRAVSLSLGQTEEYFDNIYKNNQLLAIESGLEACPVYPALKALLCNEPHGFLGIFGELLARLDRYERSKPIDWPKSAKGLANMVRRIAPALRELDYDIRFEKKRSESGMRVSIEKLN